MDLNDEIYVQVDGEGRLVLPPQVASRYHLQPGTKVSLQDNTSGLILNSPTKLAKLYIEPTNQCNLDCRTCIRNDWDESGGMISAEVFERIISGIRELPTKPLIFFGGFGEPLFHPQIIRMVECAKRTGSKVELITNATLLTPQMSGELIRAGLDTLWVSLDGATPESYTDIRLGAVLPEVLKNLAGFQKTVFADSDFLDAYSFVPGLHTQIGIVFVAMKRNIKDLPAVIDIGLSLGASRFLVTNVLPYTGDMCAETLYYRIVNNFGTYSLSMPEMDINETTREAISTALSKGLSVTLAGSDGGNIYGHCPFIAAGAGAISWDGYFSPCLPLLHSHTAYSGYLAYHRRFSRRWQIGNIRERSLSELWQTPEHLAFRHRVQAFDFAPCTTCGSCELSEKNEEDCIGNSFPTCGGCLWSQGVIRCP